MNKKISLSLAWAAVLIFGVLVIWLPSLVGSAASSSTAYPAPITPGPKQATGYPAPSPRGPGSPDQRSDIATQSALATQLAIIRLRVALKLPDRGA